MTTPDPPASDECPFPIQRLPSEIIHHIMGFVDFDTVRAWLKTTPTSEAEEMLQGLADHAHCKTLICCEEYHRLCHQEVPANCVEMVTQVYYRFQEMPDPGLQTLLEMAANVHCHWLFRNLGKMVVLYDWVKYPYNSPPGSKHVITMKSLKGLRSVKRPKATPI